MRATFFMTAGGIAALFGAGCGPSFHVQTMAAPDAGLSTLSTFRVLPVPQPRDGRARAGSYDPMVNNSITNRALRETLTQAFAGRGYVVNEQSPDFEVAVYASAHEKLDVTLWDYGYPYWPRWGWSRLRRETVTEYTEGTVVVDVVRSRTRELLWRGSGTARLTEDPVRDIKELQKVAAAVIKEFARSSVQPLAAAQ